MLGLAITALVTIIALTSVAVLLDCWMRGRFLFEKLRHERALIDAGFVSTPPLAGPGGYKMRRPLGFDALATPARIPGSRRLAGGARAEGFTAPGPDVCAERQSFSLPHRAPGAA